ncbi:MAG TPA: hypothetical protein VKB34_16925 [Povalibacter sp.]|nr:hypothetical protein [Povalibacter sp.]
MPAALVLLAIGVLLYLALRGKAVPVPDDTAAEEELLRLCLGDREQVERLMALESRDAPQMPRSEAARRALTALRRDLK